MSRALQAIRSALGYALGALGMVFALIAVGLIILAQRTAGWEPGDGIEL